ncbi:DUF11 domain-containing protein [Changpingibacter yushuensis]|uniref:DUF11 domain-containing protein n=1 Tax=Changpingibacter yushuensis TaxID=2758440 RepID=UPI0015F6AEA2|nr:DUF11 domain-containing protein [Changpingibacter yushuensis]
MSPTTLKRPSRLLAGITALMLTGSALALPVAALAVSNPAETLGAAAQPFYAYVKAGETVSVKVDTAEASWVRDNTGAQTNLVKGKVTELEATSDGVWQIFVGGDRVATSVTPKELQPFDIQVMSGQSEQEGRIWTERLSMLQDGGSSVQDGADLTFWAINDSGYEYKIDLANYNGVNSAIEFDAVGNVEDDSCISSFASAEIAGDGDEWEVRPDCAGKYRLFFEEPSSELPDQATVVNSYSADGANKTVWVKPDPLDAAALVSGTTLSFTQGSNPASLGGTFNISVPERFSGTAILEIDVDGNGSYDDDIDVSHRVAAFDSSTSTSAHWTWDGTDGQGNAINACTATPSARVVFDRVGTVHVLSEDVENRSGGITITKINGDQAGDTTVYWNDSDLGDTYSNADGTQRTRIDVEANRVNNSQTGVDSSAGVHKWSAPTSSSNMSWGDRRMIDDWTYTILPEGTAAASVAVASTLDSCSSLAIEKEAVSTTNITDTTATVQWLVTAHNTSDVTATDVVAADVFPEGIVDGQTEVLNVSAGTFDVETGVWTIGTMEAGGEESLAFTTVVERDKDAETTVTNRVSIANPDNPFGPENEDQCTDDTLNQCDEDTVTIPPTQTATLAIEKKAVSTSDITDTTATVEWLITAHNTSDVTATDVVASDVFPEGILDGQTELVGVSTGTFDTETGEWTIGTMDAGAQATLSFTTVVERDKDANTTITNRVSIANPDNPFGPEDEDQCTDDTLNQCDEDAVTIPPTQTATLAIEKAAVDVTDVTDTTATVEWLITAHNTSDVTATDVVATDVFPQGILDGQTELLDVSVGTFDADAGVWTIGTMEAGQRETLSFTTVVERDKSAETTVTNRVSIANPDNPFGPEDENQCTDDTLNQCDQDTVVIPVTTPETPATPESGGGKGAVTGVAFDETNPALVGLGVLLALGAAGGGVYLYRKNRNHTLSTDDTE